MKSSLDHLPQRKQRELERVVEILHEEFEDALKGSTAEWKKKGRILKIILFGSYARGTWVDEPHTMKGYRSDYDVLVVVNNRKLTDPEYWYKAEDRFIRDKAVRPEVSFIVHSRREVNAALREGQFFFSDIRREGIVLYELDEEPLAEPKALSPKDRLRVAKAHFEGRHSSALKFLEMARLALERGWNNNAAFQLHQSVEQVYSTFLLVLTNYDPATHNIKFLRSLAEDHDRRLADAWPRDERRFAAWFNTLKEAYVKARYSPHYEISEEALQWLGERTAELCALVETVCREHLEALEGAAE